ncbi:Hypothetical_protein [Hexamita inflata]|uniref:Hypothetical_protein n=1 Tax=Hexamita inflata TaxID=28002 RepID=A0AA86NPW6_9EUKA|nr:Hypothetical protein HINF_LOCUS11278 [Hexamita inflata]CAI9938918.1 Hypothetical protein HINF_LOCUS26563 [Hexamita inflata]
MDSFSITNFNLSSHFVDPSSNSGLIISTPLVQVAVSISGFQYCSQYDILVGWSYYSALVASSQPAYNCDSICDQLFFVYGMCLDGLQSSQTNGKILTCGENFAFAGDSCVCQEGYILNISQCINVVGYLNQLQVALRTQRERLDNLSNIVSANMEQTGTSIVGNISALNTNIQENIQLLDGQISKNVSYLQNQITLNKNSHNQLMTTIQLQLEENIIQNVSSLEAKLALNSSILESRLSNNISSVAQNITTLNSSFLEFKSATTGQFSSIQSQLNSVNNYIQVANTKSNTLQQSITTVNSTLQNQINDLKYRLDEIKFTTMNSLFYLCLAKDDCQFYFRTNVNTVDQ